MPAASSLAPAPFLTPLVPEDLDQGDPFAFAPPEQAGARFRYYVYTTGEEPVGGRAFPVYGSDDLVTWRGLGTRYGSGARALIGRRACNTYPA